MDAMGFFTKQKSNIDVGSVIEKMILLEAEAIISSLVIKGSTVDYYTEHSENYTQVESRTSCWFWSERIGNN